jgi:uncharacterized protein YigE (DUF2233 family)
VTVLLALVLAATPGLDAREVTFAGATFQVVTLDTTKVDVAVRRECEGDGAGKPCETLARAKQGMVFATNAGIFEPGLAPTGLLVAGGTQVSPLNTAKGEGNFFMSPNGVFFVSPKGVPMVLDTAAYARALPAVVSATQSGPLLVHHGVINAAFTDGSRNRNVRSAVGVRGRDVVVVLSVGEVNFFTLASLFTLELKVDDALYLDGFISELVVEGLTPPRRPFRSFAAFLVAKPR